MPNTTIQIKRSGVTSVPPNGTLSAGEQAYSYASNTLFIGTSDNSGSIPIGGKYWIDISNSAFNQANAAFNAANNAVTDYSPAFIQANTARDTANAAFNAANNAVTDYSPAFIQANTARDVANISFTQANAAFNAANNAVTDYSPAFIQANTARDTANAAFSQANTARDTANTKFSSSGGTITGDVSIVGNLNLSGNTSLINVSTLSVTDPLLYLAANNYLADIVDIGFVANYVNSTGSNVHTGLYREHTTKEYYLFQEYNKEPENNHIDPNANGFTISVLNADIRTSNLNLAGTNAVIWIKNSYDQANTARDNANIAFAHANAAFLKANSIVPGGLNTQIQFNNSGVFGGASGLTTNGTELTIASGTKTASAPFIDATQTWDNSGVTFTGFRFNATDTASAAASLLLDLQVGGTSQFRVRKDGVASVGNSSGGGGLIITPAGSFQPFLSRDGLGGLILGNVGGNNLPVHIGAADVSITRRGAANFIHGGSDAGLNSATVTITIASPAVISWNFHRLSTGTPVTFTTTGALPTGITSGTTYYVIFVSDGTFQIATTLANALSGTAINTSGTQSGTHTGNRWAITQRLSVQGVTGVSNIPGTDFFIQGSQGTGSGAGGSIVFQVAPAGGSGTAQNSLATALTIASDRNVTIGAVNGTGLIVGLGGGVIQDATGFLRIVGSNELRVQTADFRVLRDSLIGWSSSNTAVSTPSDLILTRRAAASLRLGAADTSASATVTVTIASPGVVTWTSHGLSTGTPVIFTTTGALPTGITADTTYYAIVVDSNTFQIAASFANALAGTAVNTSGTQSGTHTGRRGAIAQQFGPQDTLSVSSSTNIDGADFVIRGSRSIGNKPGGSIIFQVAPSGASGTAQNALANVLQLNGAGGITGWDGATANTLALRNGTNAQLFRVYSTFNGTNDAYGAIGAGVNLNGTAGNADTLYIGSQKQGSPTALTKMAIQVDGTTRLDYNITNAGQWWTSAGFGCGAILQANNIISLSDLRAAVSIFWNGRSQMQSPSNGDLLFANLAVTDFGRLMFGGTSASFPALKRSSATLQVRLADDSGDADFTAKSLTLSGSINVSSTSVLTGNVGIGITSPTSNLHVIGNANVSSNIRIGGFVSFDNNDFVRINEPVANTFVINTASTERLRVDSQGNVSIGTTSTLYKLEVAGSFAAQTKSFVIDHPTKPGKTLRYASLEGPENGVYVRGKLDNENVIVLPDYWTGLVDEETITVNLTPIGSSQNLYVQQIGNNKVVVCSSSKTKPIKCYYTVYGERKDVEKLIVEI